MNHLSSTDAAFLHLETPETPMHVGSLMLFELPAGYKGDYYEDVKAMVAERRHLGSLFNRKLAQMPFELADPVWIEDDDIDLDYHVRFHTLRRPGNMEQLEALVARLHATLLDRSRPLWELYVIDGLENGQVATYTKAHHSGIDGKAGVELAKVFYDVTPEMRAVRPPRAARAGNAYQLGVAELLQAGVSNAIAQYVKVGKLVPQAVKAIGAAGKLIATRANEKGARSLSLGLAPKSIFNVSITNQRSFSTLSVPLADIKALGKRVGGTVNTVVMTMCAGALRSFLIERDLLPKKSLIAGVPVSLRGANDDSLNNQVSAIRVDLATTLASTAERFKAIHASSEAAKAVVSELKPVLGLDLPITGAPWLMSGMATLFGRSNLAGRMPAVANVAISNVPGLPMPLYMAGARMLHYFPVSIPYHGMGLNITVQSYAGMLEFGITACRRVMSQEESHELIDYLRTTLEEIRALDSVEERPPAEMMVMAAVPTPAPAPAPKASRPRAPVRTKSAAAKPSGAKTARAKSAAVKTASAKRTRAAGGAASKRAG
ncbi:MAG: wax ester/triacylglycerol synthase family O-acyltransferase [Burkholderiaceae bacterium]